MEKKEQAAHIRAIADAIENEPDSYDQRFWCGTAYCIAGHSLALMYPERFRAAIDRHEWFSGGAVMTNQKRSELAGMVLDGQFGLLWTTDVRRTLGCLWDSFGEHAGPLVQGVSVPGALRLIADEIEAGENPQRAWAEHWG